MAEQEESVQYVERLYGLSLVNSEGLPEVHLSKVCVIKGHQIFSVRTDRMTFSFRVTPSGLLRVDSAPVSRAS